ncbi:hypothetical protein CY34DRAFT_727509 [Suillus luteus UH-Slu-Lm8-n1]|uniref:F-box domain-containing protein n=1 Tax=Suillus luteus UH-Slu-Lm8-n1 TaxID=930992 RepID=A0A0C9ZZR0_9AGAM|nr:hypothetical protein CY34DRAFT_727509 [Suillus luteus UH-Slu-Lm8-n1]
MHRAFYSDDIIYSVLTHLRFSPTDLKNVATTCPRLAGPALDILWSEQSSLVPLIMCLPEDARKIMDRTIHLSREPTPSEWERLRITASRVRKFIEPDSDVYDAFYPKLCVSGLVLRRLFEQFSSPMLFPNLFTFDYKALQEYNPDLSVVRMFMSAGLEALFLDVFAQFPTHEAEQFLAALPVEAHGLRELSISMDDGDTAFAVLPSFGMLPKLITLTISGVDVYMTRQAITNIQQARCLNTLNLNLHGTAYDHDGGIMALELSSLERLSLSGDVLPVHALHSSNHYSSTIIRHYRVPPTSFPDRNHCVYGIVIHIVPKSWILETDLYGGRNRSGKR